ncbi:DUF4112 domain-containing protein [Phenylobacterium sp.]|uniref:DUF4112 domain-containing protein n=1 Tax=Phenylobacterium sp. TaxID=1871053 RepID=UPI003565100C
MTTTKDRAHRAWRNAERIKQLSDNLIKIGPWGIGLDGVLAWVPAANTIYSVGAGGLLIYEAIKAGAGSWTLARMAAYLVLNSAMTDFPIVGWAMDTLFRGHLMAANALQKDIEARFGPAEVAVDAASWRPVRRSVP